ncbi:MAG: hypothetical protein RI920_1078, partial [Pseudomonadota bacterium]
CEQEGVSKTVLLETKGMHLAGSGDTAYKRNLLNRLTASFRDERWQTVGQLALQSGSQQDLVCELLMDQTWQSDAGARFFS